MLNVSRNIHFCFLGNQSEIYKNNVLKRLLQTIKNIISIIFPSFKLK